MTKKLSLKLALFLSLALSFILSISVARAATSVGALAAKLSGRILLQVQDNGKAWYIEPKSLERVYLGTPDNALAAVRAFGLGISNADLAKIDMNATFAKKLSGKILLQAQAHGEAWYVNPTTLKKYYLGRPSDMLTAMKNLGLGITNVNLNTISVLNNYGDNSGATVGGAPTSTPPVAPVATSTAITITPVSTTTPTSTLSLVCTSWTYSDWSACVNGQQTRTLVSSSPASCTGGTPVLNRACELSFAVNVLAANSPYFQLTSSGASTAISYELDNLSLISIASISGLSMDNILDQANGASYAGNTNLTVYDRDNNILATKALVNDGTSNLIFSNPVLIGPKSSSTIMVKIEGFSGDTASIHLITRLTNFTTTASAPVVTFNGLSVDSNIYRR